MSEPQAAARGLERKRLACNCRTPFLWGCKRGRLRSGPVAGLQLARPLPIALLAGACNGLPRRIAPKVPRRKVWVVLFTRAVLEALAEAKPTRDT